MTEEPTKKDPEVGDPALRPPPELANSKMGIACLALLLLFVGGIIVVAAIASAG